MAIGDNVWRRRWFVLAAVLGLSLFTYTTEAQKPVSPILSQNAQGNAVASTSISKSTQASEKNVLRISRRKTAVGESRIGVMAYEGNILCYTLEHDSLKIPAGTYKAELRYSRRFKRLVPYIHVPGRSGIEIHPGNCPHDSGGCVLVGSKADMTCVLYSRMAFKKVMNTLPQNFTVVVE